MKKFSTMTRGFTLIELLVVISIIGLLSSIVLVALNGARQKGVIAAALEFATTNYHALGDQDVLDMNFNGSGVFVDSTGNFVPTSDSVTTRDPTDTPIPDGGSSYVSGGKLVMTRTTPLNFPSADRTYSVWAKGSVYDGLLVSPYPSGGNTDRLEDQRGRNSNIACFIDGLNGASFQLAPDTNWHNIVCSYNSSTNKIFTYVDGKSVTNDYNSVGTPTNYPFLSVGIGVASDGTGPAYAGKLDNIQIFSEALTSQAVYKLYALGAAKHGIAVK